MKTPDFLVQDCYKTPTSQVQLRAGKSNLVWNPAFGNGYTQYLVKYSVTSLVDAFGAFNTILESNKLTIIECLYIPD